MQPLKAVASPSSLSIIGWFDVDSVSRMLRRRWPNPTRSCTKRPLESGPRRQRLSAMAEMEEAEAGSRNDISPQSPHIRGRPINKYTPPMRRALVVFQNHDFLLIAFAN